MDVLRQPIQFNFLNQQPKFPQSWDRYSVCLYWNIINITPKFRTLSARGNDFRLQFLFFFGRRVAFSALASSGIGLVLSAFTFRREFLLGRELSCLFSWGWQLRTQRPCTHFHPGRRRKNLKGLTNFLSPSHSLSCFLGRRLKGRRWEWGSFPSKWDACVIYTCPSLCWDAGAALLRHGRG